MNSRGINEINVLELRLHGRLVGYLGGYTKGRNRLVFVDEFKTNINRSTFSLITHPNFPNSEEFMTVGFYQHLCRTSARL